MRQLVSERILMNRLADANYETHVPSIHTGRGKTFESCIILSWDSITNWFKNCL